MLIGGCNLGFMGSAGSSGGLNAVNYNGTSDFLSRSSAFTSAPDTGTGILSFWFRRDALTASGTDQMILDIGFGASAFVQFGFLDDQKFFAYISSGANVLWFRTAATFTVSTTWHNVLINYDVNQTTGNRVQQLYIDSASDSASVTNSGAAFTNNFAASTSARVCGNTNAPTRYFDGGVSELYWAPNQSLDISNSTNREKFIDGGEPVDLGSNGSTPTGVAPLLYLPNRASIVNQNEGTGGNLVINGTPADAPTTP